MPRRSLALAVLMLAGCAHPGASTPPELTVEQVAPLFPARVQDPDGWARDLVLALQVDHLPVDLEHVCSVIAVAEQESGVQANPAVPGLPAIARRALGEKAKPLGPLGPVVLERLLDGKAPGSSKTFEQRIDTLRTEADLDHLFRDILADHQRRTPVLYAAANAGATLFGAANLEEHNPVTTIGSMQVSVRFAEEHAAALHRDVHTARDELYTRAGGLLHGAARLWSFEARYDSLLYRFADYNAGPYSSRNAAFQEQLAELTHEPLALDGDLLSYDRAGEVKHGDTRTLAALRAFRDASAPALRVEHDAREEKRLEFERSATWLAVKAAHQKRHQRPAPYARLPEVVLESPKLSTPRSTAWFARAVDRRYRACLERRR